MKINKSLQLSQTASSKLQYDINVSIIFNYLRQNGPMSRSEISRNLNISAPAVSRAVSELLKNDYLLEIGKVKTKNGRRPLLLKVNNRKGFVMGIDLGKERFKAALTDFEGKIIKKYQTFKVSEAKDMVGKVIDEVKNILDDVSQKLGTERLNAICIGAPVDVDMESGKIIGVPNYEVWEKSLNVLKEILQGKFDVPVYIENDVNLSVLGEKHYGEGKKFKDVSFVEVSNGIGAGIIIDNCLFRGSQGCAGEIGFMLINAKNKEEFLEEFSSLESVRNKVARKIEEGEKTIITDMVQGDTTKIESSLVFEAAIKGDRLAKNVIEEMIDYLSVGITNLILTLNPEIVILGGDICTLPKVNELILEPIAKRVKELTPFSSIPEIRLSSLGEDACIIGASFMAIESLLLGEFPYQINLEMCS